MAPAVIEPAPCAWERLVGTGAVIATDDRLMADAIEAARKLGIRVLLTDETPTTDGLPAAVESPPAPPSSGGLNSDSICRRVR